MQNEKDTIGALLPQVCRLHHDRARTLFNTLGLYRGQPPLLFALWEQDGLAHSELADRLQVSAATITKMVQRMERAGFVACRPDPDDQRVSHVYLSDAGLAVQANVRQVFGTFEEETLAGFTLEERVLLRRFLLHIRDNLARVTGEHPGL
jgi:DNA-binding MarR family transcriptional regulator